MTDRKPRDDEERALWREAARRLGNVDVEPPLRLDQIDALGRTLGERPDGQGLHDWLRGRGNAMRAIPGFDPTTQRLRTVASFVRLAADTAGGRMPLPERELETQDGQFRLRAGSEDGRIVLALQALGYAADDFAHRSVALVSLEDQEVPVAVLTLDGDGDGEERFPDHSELRRALLRPVIALVEPA